MVKNTLKKVLTTARQRGKITKRSRERVVKSFRNEANRCIK